MGTRRRTNRRGRDRPWPSQTACAQYLSQRPRLSRPAARLHVCPGGHGGPRACAVSGGIGVHRNYARARAACGGRVLADGAAAIRQSADRSPSFANCRRWRLETRRARISAHDLECKGGRRGARSGTRGPRLAGLDRGRSRCGARRSEAASAGDSDKFRPEGRHFRGSRVTRIVCIGECMVELRAVGADTFARSYAGDAYNTAVYLKRSLPAAQVQFLTATGDDAMSKAMRRVWRVQEIDDALAFPVAGGRVGLYLIETDAFGERSFQYLRKDFAASRWLALLEEAGEPALHGAGIGF